METLQVMGNKRELMYEGAKLYVTKLIFLIRQNPIIQTKINTILPNETLNLLESTVHPFLIKRSL